MTRLDWWKRACGVVLFCTVAMISSSAQVFTTLLEFDGTNGANPYFMALAQGRDGDLYGTTIGTIFKMTPSGTLTTLYQGGSYNGLVLGTDGNFYGIVGSGFIFRMTAGGKLTFLNSLDGMAYGGLVQATDGNFYGTTYSGGAYGLGQVFEITPDGVLTTIHSFNGDDGQWPYSTLIQAKDGNLYGTTYLGGAHYAGTVFKLSPAGRFTTLHDFDFAKGEGVQPTAGVVEGTDGNFYGTTYYGCGGAGSVFKITPKGDFTTLACGGNVGGEPYGGALIQATDGNFYGTFLVSGLYGWGSVFQITPSGVMTAIHSFNELDGGSPFGGLVQGTDGEIYGATLRGGNLSCGGGDGCGTVFSIDMAFGPFIRLVRDSGKVGGSGGILGQGFTGTTDVSLNGTPASFTVFSDTFLKATVPNGATSGFVTVTTPSGRLTSNKPFRVTPQLLSFDPPSGPVGTQVTITGVSLTQTKGVGFGNRVPAQFTVNSDTQVTATVPLGAKTGKVGIETKGGVAVSQGTFTVTQ